MVGDQSPQLRQIPPTFTVAVPSAIPYLPPLAARLQSLPCPYGRRVPRLLPRHLPDTLLLTPQTPGQRIRDQPWAFPPAQAWHPGERQLHAPGPPVASPIQSQ